MELKINGVEAAKLVKPTSRFKCVIFVLIRYLKMNIASLTALGMVVQYSARFLYSVVLC